MLTRVLEPEVMDGPDEAFDYDSMDHSEVNRKFVDDLLEFAGSSMIQPEADDVELPVVEILDLGTGTAQIPIELCQRGEGFRIVACDLSTSMLDLAIMKIDIAGLRWRILLSHADAKELPYDTGRFDVIMSNSIVHHIPDPSVALREAARVLKPGGLIFVRDLLRPADDAEVQHLVATYAADCNEHQRNLFDASLRAALSLDEIRAIVTDLGGKPEGVQQTSDRHWTWAATASA